MHPRQFALLSDGALSYFAFLYALLEVVGDVPGILQSLLIALIRKPTGGRRPVAHFRAWFRVWQRARKSQVQEWERTHGAAPEFNTGSRQCTPDAVWRATLIAETATTLLRHLAVVLWDLRRCFDHVQHAQLADEASEGCFPLVLLRVAVAAY